jgi:hypothetical protein
MVIPPEEPRLVTRGRRLPCPASGPYHSHDGRAGERPSCFRGHGTDGCAAGTGLETAAREMDMQKLKLELDGLKVDSFELSTEEGRKGTVMGNAASLLICSGSCTPAGSCFDGCYTASAARPYCY